MPAPRKISTPNVVVRLRPPWNPAEPWTVEDENGDELVHGGSAGRALDKLVNWAHDSGATVALDGLGLKIVPPPAPAHEHQPPHAPTPETGTDC
jgi:hypothetical protein